MFCKLKSRFALRGYKDAPYAIADLSTGSSQCLSPITFQAFSFCDGFTDLDNSSYVLPIHKKIVEKLLERHSPIIALCKQGDKVLPQQKYKYFNNQRIETAHWSITGKCNYKCRHCFLSAPESKFGELSTSECLRVIDELADCGINQVSITGGEPLVRCDFLKLLDAFKKNNVIVVQIYTNGALVNDKLLDELEGRGMKPSFSISYDGIGWHDWMRGIKGAEKMAFALLTFYIQEIFA